MKVIYEDVYDPDYSECICTLFIGNTVVRVVNDKNSMIHFRQFDNMEVVIRGYLILNYYGDMNILIFDNNRHDLRLPTYADSEVASMIQQSLVRELQEMMIFSYDKFILPELIFYWVAILLGLYQDQRLLIMTLKQSDSLILLNQPV